MSGCGDTLPASLERKQRLALEAHRRGLESARRVAVLGAGAAWIWVLAAAPFPGALHIVDWCHASERI